VLRLIPSCLALLGAVTLAAACSSAGEGGRQVQITQGDQGCTPASVQVTPGEKLQLVVENVTGKTYEVEGIDGTQLEEVLVPEGRTRTVGYTVPDQAGTYKVKCYSPGDVSTIIELRAGGGAGGDSQPDTTATGAGPTKQGVTLGEADTTVSVKLADFSVTPDKASVSAGRVKFTAENLSDSLVHELAVLKVKDNGSFDVIGEIEDIPAGDQGSVVLELTPGAYQLACLIVPGEAGSTVDHYTEGMHTDFLVE